MKRFALLAFSVALVSCEKNADIVESADQTVYEITFNVSDFGWRAANQREGELRPATKGEVTSGAPWGGRALVQFEYLVYNAANGKLVKRAFKEFQKGPITEELPAGKYYIDFIGCDGAYYYQVWDIENRGTAYASAGAPPHGYFPTMYSKSMDLNLTSDTTLGNITLERVTGNISVRLYDSHIPDSLSVWATAASVNGFYFADNNPDQTELVYKERIGRKPSQTHNSYSPRIFDLPVFPYKSRYDTLRSTVNIWATTRSGDTIAAKTISDIEVMPNKKIILKGYLLRGENSEIPPISGLDWHDDPLPGYPEPPEEDLRYIDGYVEADSLYDEIERIEF